MRIQNSLKINLPFNDIKFEVPPLSSNQEEMNRILQESTKVDGR